MIKHIAVAIALSLAPVAFAQMYIVPEGDCGAVTLHVTRGTDFPNLGEAISADRVKDAHVVRDRPIERVIVTPVAGPRSLDFSANVPDREGVVMAAVDLKPVVSGNETRTEHAKAFLFCGATTPRADWQLEAGLGLEIIPQWNGIRPKMKQGDEMQFIVVHKTTGHPIQDVPVELYGAGEGRIGAGVPNQSGGVSFPYPKPGRYMVTTTYRRPDPQQAEHWLVDTSTLTFEIK
ncbi:MAG TPA: DUF4198 domain-containing protein [Thermoanaerobaculia bacterium]|nr:DUF4198 domain-containing protein [Thermoanaerobaculia bacterium]